MTQFDANHIPSGFLHDIIDDNNYNIANGLGDNPSNLPDHISGFNISTIFNNMGANTSSAVGLINNLGQTLPVGVLNTTVNYDSLRTAYNY